VLENRGSRGGLLEVEFLHEEIALQREKGAAGLATAPNS